MKKTTRKTSKPATQKKAETVISGSPVFKPKGPDGWKKAPKPTGKFHKWTEYGQTLVGKFLGIEPSKKKNFSDSLKIETAEGVVMVAMSYDLEPMFTSGLIKEGKQVQIMFTDAVPLKNGKSMKKFEVWYK